MFIHRLSTNVAVLRTFLMLWIMDRVVILTTLAHFLRTRIQKIQEIHILFTLYFDKKAYLCFLFTKRNVFCNTFQAKSSNANRINLFFVL
ncbi:MAG: hypothetical protein RL329_1997 [Bacteroidota bacterium]